MEVLEGFVIDNVGFKPKYQGDLLFFDGPLLSHFVNEDNEEEHYFYKWTDCDDHFNRWLIFKISTNKLADFFNKKVSLLELIKMNPFVHYVDLDKDINPAKIIISPTKDIPDDYLPSSNSFYEIGEYHEYADLLKDKILSETQPKDKLELILQEIATIKSEQEKQTKKFDNFVKKVNIQSIPQTPKRRGNPSVYQLPEERK